MRFAVVRELAINDFVAESSIRPRVDEAEYLVILASLSDSFMLILVVVLNAYEILVQLPV